MNKQVVSNDTRKFLQEFESKYYGKIVKAKFNNICGLAAGSLLTVVGKPCIQSWGNASNQNSVFTVTCSMADSSGGALSYGLRITDFELAEDSDEIIIGTTKAELTKMKETLKQQLDVVEMKLKFIKESGAKEFNEKEFKAYQTLELVSKPGLSNLEKAQLIAKLF